MKAAIEAKSPKTLKEADNYKESGKAGEVKGEVKGLVTQGKEGQAKDIEAATEAPPDQSKAVAEAGHADGRRSSRGRPRRSRPTGAVPKPAPAEQINLAAGKHAGQPGDGRRRGHRAAAGAVERARVPERRSPTRRPRPRTPTPRPAEFRAAGAGGHRSRARPRPPRRPPRASPGMQGAKGAALAKLVADKGKTKSKDEAKRAEVTDEDPGHLRRHRGGREEDPRRHRPEGGGGVRDRARPAPEAAFETYVAAKMSAYKKDRYGGWLGGLRWAKDKLLGMPDKVNEFYEAGRELYLKQMDGVISRVADIVGSDLTAAKKRIATGKAEIATYVKSLPADLQKVGSEASKEIGDKFEQLESDVNAKQESVVDTLATKYVEARKGLDERIEALQAENKGLVDKAIGAIKAVINTIRELAAMLKNVLVPGGRRRRRHHQEPGRLPRQPDRRREGRHPQVQGQHRRPPPQGPDGLAVRRARRGRRRAARHVRHQGHHQAARLDLRPDLGQHPQPARQADRREGDGGGREGRRDLPDHRRRRASPDCGRCWWRSSATSRR